MNNKGRCDAAAVAAVLERRLRRDRVKTAGRRAHSSSMLSSSEPEASEPAFSFSFDFLLFFSLPSFFFFFSFYSHRTMHAKSESAPLRSA